MLLGWQLCHKKPRSTSQETKGIKVTGNHIKPCKSVHKMWAGKEDGDVWCLGSRTARRSCSAQFWRRGDKTAGLRTARKRRPPSKTRMSCPDVDSVRSRKIPAPKCQSSQNPLTAKLDFCNYKHSLRAGTRELADLIRSCKNLAKNRFRIFILTLVKTYKES